MDRARGPLADRATDGACTVTGDLAEQRLSFRVPVPPDDWVEVPLDVSIQAMAEQRYADEIRRGDEGAKVRRDSFVQVLGDCAADATARGAQLAYLRWQPEAGTMPSSSLTVSTVRLTQDIGELTQLLSDPRPGDLSPRTVETVDVHSGQSVRVRFFASGGRSLDDGHIITDVVQYWLPIPDADCVVTLSCVTTAVAQGEDVAAVVDRIADHFELLT